VSSDIFDLSHVPVPDAAAAVTHKNVVVNKPDGAAGEHVPVKQMDECRDRHHDR
jgi:hypothetical protein